MTLSSYFSGFMIITLILVVIFVTGCESGLVEKQVEVLNLDKCTYYEMIEPEDAISTFVYNCNPEGLCCIFHESWGGCTSAECYQK